MPSVFFSCLHSRHLVLIYDGRAPHFPGLRVRRRMRGRRRLAISGNELIARLCGRSENPTTVTTSAHRAYMRFVAGDNEQLKV